jgi:protein SCO1/2
MKKHHFVVMLAVAVVVIALVFFVPHKAGETPNAITSQAQSTGEAAIGGPFTLSNQKGETVTQATYAGKLMLVFFGFTYCPEICPTDLTVMGNAMKMLTPEEATQVVPIFITVDPERDTVEQMKTYLSSFDPSIQGLTGTREQVDGAIKSYRVYAKKVEDPGSTDYTMDHSAYFYLMGRDGKYLIHFPHGEKPEAIVEAIRQHLKG